MAWGTNVTFTLVATGSEPMRYQWYFNDTAMAQATAASLTLSNLTWAAAGNYSVTVSNVVGGSNALAVLTVMPETVKPNIAITSPTNRQCGSNSVFNVTGPAGDNAAVSNVWFQVNSNGWQPAASANHWTNWTATANLVSGTNPLQALAMDTCGNYSPPLRSA
jgi:hypothetical protein